MTCRHAGFLLALLAASPLFSLNPDLSIGQYLHTSWTQEEGNALPPIHAIAQTADGYLWLGTGKGLIRFDGLKFVEWSPASGPALPSTDIRCLRAASGGGLWVGTTSGFCRRTSCLAA
jgi:ligand-binding sensor domain-containing protein